MCGHFTFSDPTGIPEAFHLAKLSARLFRSAMQILLAPFAMLDHKFLFALHLVVHAVTHHRIEDPRQLVRRRRDRLRDA